jgi:hypothetical protein
MSTGRGLTRRDALGRFGAVLAGAWLLDVAAPAAAQTGDAYWAFADRCQRLLDDLWSRGLGHYQTGGRAETSLNASLLFTHAIAALTGHQGPARQDERARAIAWRLCQVPPWRPEGTGPPAPGGAWDQTHDWGWGTTMDSHESQHVSIDAAVVRGLAQAWLAREPLGIDPATGDAIVTAIQRCATSPFYAYPALRLNQINWPIEIFGWAAAVTGETWLLHHETRLQLARFADALTRVVPPFRIPFTGPGYRFHYVPGDRAGARANLDNPEYATTVCGALQFYEAALRAGMDPLNPRRRAAMVAWVERVLCGYWTHGGYLNWDTGAAFRRWHQGKKFGLAQAALLGIATAPSLQPAPEYGRWAKYLFDRGLELFDRWSRGGSELPPPVLFGVTRTPGGIGDARLTAARMQENAARAVSLGLGAMASEAPPPLYAYDPDVGRLAVTTPAYSTAITVVDGERLPYGGAEIARLFDGDMRVAAGIGGRPPAAFGVVARSHRNGHVVASQRGRPRASLEHPPLRLLEAPRGAVARPEAYPDRPYAGPFRTLEAVAVTRGDGVAITTLHRFRPEWVETRWTIEPREHRGTIEPRRRARGRWSVDVLFPSTGDAAVFATLEDGRRERLGAGTRRLGDVRWLHVAGEESGYVIVPLDPPAARMRLLQPEPQDSAPDPGPTLAIALLARAPLRRMSFAARIAPASLTEAASVAARLR